jgi:hypothetical protein
MPSGALAVGDAGSGAFGPQPGNVTIKAGGSVFGHFVEANGIGTITAGVNAGGTSSRNGFALSLVKGNWNVYAPNGNIYLQEVRNPNGDFDSVAGGGGYFTFDYDPLASVFLDAGSGVILGSTSVPRGGLAAGTSAPGILLPPTLDIVAGAGGITLVSDVTLFPSPYGELNISTTGNFIGQTVVNIGRPTLYMSDSGNNQWQGSTSFTPTGSDHAVNPPELANPNPVTISVGGNMQNVIVATSKRTEINVGGDMIFAGFRGENLHPGDVTSINVAGRIINPSQYTFVNLITAIIGADPLEPSAWDSIFNLAVNPNASALLNGLSQSDLVNLGDTVKNMRVFQTGNPGFVYDPQTLQLGYSGVMDSLVRDAIEGDKNGKFTILKLDNNGVPLLAKGDANLGQDTSKYYFQIQTVSFAPKSAIESLYAGSQSVPLATSSAGLVGYKIGGPGQFNITASSIDLGTTAGIQSLGVDTEGNYRSLANLTPEGAAINVTTLSGDLSMISSRISSEFGGDITVNCGGSIDLGRQDLFGSTGNAFGIWTSGHSSIFVTALGDININGSRIAAYNGGNVFVESLQGDVNAGSGGTVYVQVPIVLIDPATGLPKGDPVTAYIYGSGIVTTSLTKNLQTPGGNPLPGNITVLTPQGDIVSTTAGILQLPLDGNLGPGPVITMVAGTPPSDSSPGFAGNIDLGDSGVIGGAINLTAQGNIKGLVISRQNSTISAAQNFSGTVLSAGSANISAGGNVSGTIIGITGVSASGGNISATLLSQNVSVSGGSAESTLGSTATATATSQSAAQATTTDTKQTTSNTDEDDSQKKRNRPKLTKRSRVTVILPKT